MDDYYSPDAINARAAERKQQDFKDFQDELSDRDNGKIKRFTSEAERAKRSGRALEAQRQKQYQQATLAMMLENPEYAALYNNTMSALNDTETVVYDALVESAEQVEDTRKALEDAEKNGASEEELDRLREQHKEAQDRHQKMLEHEERLREIRARMEDKNNPPTQEEMEGFQKELDGIKADAQKQYDKDADLEVKPAQTVIVPDLPLGAP